MICKVCGGDSNTCICCPEDGHVCARDYGETYCPICFPDPAKSELKITATL